MAQVKDKTKKFNALEEQAKSSPVIADFLKDTTADIKEENKKSYVRYLEDLNKLDNIKLSDETKILLNCYIEFQYIYERIANVLYKKYGGVQADEILSRKENKALLEVDNIIIKFVGWNLTDFLGIKEQQEV
jgi:hypothetical protein